MKCRYIFFSFAFLFFNCVYSQSNLEKVYESHGNKLEFGVYNSSDCASSNSESILYVKYSFPRGIDIGSDRWLEWKMDYFDCNGELNTQQFYAPLHSNFFEAFNYFVSAPPPNQAFDFQSEGVYPKTLPKFKQFVPGAYEVKEFVRSNFKPSSFPNPQKKCGIVQYQFINKEVDEIELSWSECKDCSEIILRHRISGEDAWQEEKIIANSKKGSKAKPIILEKSKLFSSLLVDTVYEFQICSKCPYSPALNESKIEEFRTLKSQCPIPQSFQLRSAFADSLIIVWNPIPSGKYSFQYRLSSDRKWETTTLQEEIAEISDLELNSTYEFRVAGIDTFGIGEYSDILEISTSNNPAPAVLNIKVDSILSNSVQLKWEIDKNLPNLNRILKNTSFRCILFDIDGGKSIKIEEKEIKDLKVTFENLKYSNQYKVQVASILDDKYVNPNPTEYKFKTNGIEEKIELVCQSLYKDSLTWTFYLNRAGGKSEFYKTVSFKAKNVQNIPLNFNKDVLYYTVYTDYRGKRYDNVTINLFWDKEMALNNWDKSKKSQTVTGVDLKDKSKPYKVYVQNPSELEVIFKFSSRSVKEIKRNFHFAVNGGGYLAQYNQKNNIQLIQLSSDINMQFKRFQLRGEFIPIGAYLKTNASSQLIDKLIGITAGYSIVHKEMTIRQSAEKRFNFYRKCVISSGKKINPTYNMDLFIMAGIRRFEAETFFNLFGSLYDTKNLNCVGQQIMSADLGLQFKLNSKYILYYFQNKLKSGDFTGIPIKRYSDFSINFRFLLPFAGTMYIHDISTDEVFSRELARKDMKSGYRFSIEHSYNVRQSSLIITKGLSYVTYPDNVFRKLSGNGVFSLYMGLGITNIQRNSKVRQVDNKRS